MEGASFARSCEWLISSSSSKGKIVLREAMLLPKTLESISELDVRPKP